MKWVMLKFQLVNCYVNNVLVSRKLCCYLIQSSIHLHVPRSGIRGVSFSVIFPFLVTGYKAMVYANNKIIFSVIKTCNIILSSIIWYQSLIVEA